MKTTVMGAVFALCLVCSCQESSTTNEKTDTADSTVKPSTVSRELVMPKEEWRDPYFPRFSISLTDFNKMTENYRSGCNLAESECEMISAAYEFDQLASIEIVHGNNLEQFKGRYGADGLDEDRYRTLRGLSDGEESKVSGYATVLYSIESKNERTMGKIFYYDLASICPPPYNTCIRSQEPNDTTRN